MAVRGSAGPPYCTALVVIAWAATQRAYVLGRAAAIGFWSSLEFEQLPMPTWYGLLELWFVESHTAGLGSVAAVLDWLTDKWPEEWERMFPDAETHGTSERAQAAARKAEQMYGPSG